MEIVAFKDGTYGIRKRTLFGYRYRAFVFNREWHRLSDHGYGECLKVTEAEARREYDLLTDNGTPVAATTASGGPRDG